MTSVTDLRVTDKEILIANLLDSAVHRMNRRSGDWTTIKTNPAPYRVLETPDKDLMVMRAANPLPFARLNEQGQQQEAFGTLLKNQDFFSLMIDGFLVWSGDSIFFAGKDFGFLASFSEDGHLNYVAEMISKPLTPAMMYKEGTRWVRYNPVMACRSIAADGTVVAVLREGVTGLALRSYLDLYRIEDGVYIRSMRLPDGYDWRSVAVGGGVLYAASNERVVAWPDQVLEGGSLDPHAQVGRTLIQFYPVAMEDSGAQGT
jgi:hypothetical protein